MKLASIYVAGLLGIREASFDLTAPVALVCGANGAGKSSIRDAVALVLTADMTRVTLKKDAARLITDGADSAVAQVVTADGEDYRVTITRAGKITDSQQGHDQDPRLPYVLDAQRMAALNDTDRRAFLFGVMGTKTTHTAIADRLLARGLSDTRVRRIAPLLRAGFESAAKDAKEHASQARGAWKVVAGENYGSVKAATWRAAAPAFSADQLQRAIDAVGTADAEIAAAQQAIGADEADGRRLSEARTKIANLRAAADLIGRRRDKLTRDQAELSAVGTKLRGAEQSAGGTPRTGTLHDLARALKGVLPAVPSTSMFDLDALNLATEALRAYEAEFGAADAPAGDDELRQRLPGLRSSHKVMESAVANSLRDVQASEAAAAEIKVLEAQIAESKFDAGALGAAQATLAELQAKRKPLAAAVDQLRAAKAAAEGATEKTAKAATHHTDVVAWDAIAEALSPDGIQSEILAEAIGPFNARLEQSAVDTEWPLVLVNPDMSITAAGRLYGLLSESEKWRCDAMLAEAVTHLTGLRLLVLDRMDVLDLTGRGQLLGWLDALATTGEVDTAMVFATLKALPAGLPSTIASHWVENGYCGVLAEAA